MLFCFFFLSILLSKIKKILAKRQNLYQVLSISTNSSKFYTKIKAWLFTWWILGVLSHGHATQSENLKMEVQNFIGYTCTCTYIPWTAKCHPTLKSITLDPSCIIKENIVSLCLKTPMVLFFFFGKSTTTASYFWEDPFTVLHWILSHQRNVLIPQNMAPLLQTRWQCPNWIRLYISPLQ